MRLLDTLKGSRSYIIGAGIIAGAITYRWWPPEIRAQARELLVLAGGALAIFLRSAIADVLSQIRAGVGQQKTGPDP